MVERSKRNICWKPLCRDQRIMYFKLLYRDQMYSIWRSFKVFFSSFFFFFFFFFRPPPPGTLSLVHVLCAMSLLIVLGSCVANVWSHNPSEPTKPRPCIYIYIYINLSFLWNWSSYINKEGNSYPPPLQDIIDMSDLRYSGAVLIWWWRVMILCLQCYAHWYTTCMILTKAHQRLSDMLASTVSYWFRNIIPLHSMCIKRLETMFLHCRFERCLSMKTIVMEFALEYKTW